MLHGCLVDPYKFGSAALLAGQPYFMQMEQFSGDKIVVPCGWAHMVINKQACIKVAWDIYDPRNLPLYVRLWRELSPYCHMFDDYMAVQHVLVRLAKELTTRR